MVLSDWQVRELADYVRQGCDERGPVWGDMLDHLCCMVEARMDDGMDFRAALHDAAAGLPGSEIKETERTALTFLAMEKPYPPRMAVMALLPYALIGLVLFLDVSGFFPPAPTVIRLTQAVLLLSVLAIAAHAFIGWVRNFPRWTFPVLGIGLCTLFWLILWSISLEVDSGYWIISGTVAGIALAAVMFNRSLAPFRAIGRKVAGDPWLALFAFYPLVGWLASTNMHSTTLGPEWLLTAAVAMAVVFGWGFYRFLTLESRTRRGLALVAALAAIYAATWGLRVIFG